MLRYRVPRFTIGPKTKEIILNIGRTLNVGDTFEGAELHVTRRKCGNQPTYIFPSYGVCDETVHFEIPDEFIAEDVPKGFYDAQVVVDGCVITNIEIIKAPSRYVKSGKSVEDDCVETNWVEPPCEDEEDECNECGGLHSVVDDCVHSFKKPIDIDYLGEE